jgi:hypothetical protein
MGRTLPVANRLKNEGHITKIWFRNGVEGILAGSRNPSRVRNPAILLEQFDLIVSEGTLGSQVVDIEKMGHKVMGCGAVTEKLLKDRDYRKKVVEFLGMDKPPVEGVFVQLTGFMTPKGFSKTFMMALPSLRFMDHDKGALTGGMGSLVVYPKEDDKLTKTLLPFEAFLLKAKYIGPFTLGMHLKEDLWSISSIDTDLVPESILAGAELLATSLFDFLFGLQEGKVATVWAGVGMSVVASIPPYPFHGVVDHTRAYIDVPKEAAKHFSLGDSRLGVVGVASAKGREIREAKRRVYRTLKNSVKSPDVQYREDIGVRQEQDLASLRTWGWL